MAQVIRKRQGGLLGGLLGGNEPTTAGASLAAPSTAPAAGATSRVVVGGQSSSAAAAVPTSASVPAAVTTTAPAAITQPTTSAAQPIAQTSSSAETTPATTSASSVVRSSAPTSVRSATTVTAVSSLSSDSLSASSSGSASSSSASSSASAASDSSKSNGGGISKMVLIPIIVVASVVAGCLAIWTVIRKTALSPSRRFNNRLADVDYVAEPTDPDLIPEHGRNGSQLSGPGLGGQGSFAGPAHPATAAGYAASLARSDSGKESLRGGVAMSESMHNLPSIPYVQQPYYGAPVAYANSQPGYPSEQALYYQDLQRVGSVASFRSPASPVPVSAMPLPSGLNRMPTMQSHQPPVYDYAAQARAQSRNDMRY
ncbi:hypothetical protein Rt10032_c05g2458 [Rhodotorula toruloides]|uniref:Uncharacterized protein n=1 Tax=Rhodotorula toruloides TaxID=5286 RepID=A0A511KDJ2_RHOTO|nr:hypothetical protein Rt10032_c05g2458 [Rhodotorula toruloides]